MNPATITSWDQLPLWLTPDDMSRLYGKSLRSIERLVRLGRSAELPMPTQTRPMRWSRADVERHWQGRSTASATRRTA